MACSDLSVNTVDGVGSLTELEPPIPSQLSNTSLDFSLLTTAQLGISTQSFTPSSSCKDKSRVAQLKARRRSNVGVRGSPETNSLIRYIAQQRMKTQPATPESIRASPFSLKVSSTLKQKMASFQSLIDEEEENEMPEAGPNEANQIAGCIKTTSSLSDCRSLKEDGENCPPPMLPPPTKRRCTGPLRECVEEIREANAPILQHTTLKMHQAAVLQWRSQPGAQLQWETEPEHTGCLSPPQPPSDLVPVWHAQSSPQTHLSPTKEWQDSSFEVQSPGQAEDGGPAQPPLFRMPSLLELNPTDEGDSSGNSTTKKKKRVRFGAPLSPEFFDKNLPPSTPLQKGATPAQAPTSAGGSQLRSLLKTPQRSEATSTLSQPDFSPSQAGGSPTLSSGPCPIMDLHEGGDSTDRLGKIVYPTMEDIDSSLVDNTEGTWETQPLDFNVAFQEDLLTEVLQDPAPEPEAVSEPAPAPAPGPEPQSEPQAVGADASASTPALAPAPAPASAPARAPSRKRKQPEQSEPVKRSRRTAAKSASEKMKKAPAKRSWGGKEVDRSLYGSRSYASKDPALSPITETLSSASRSPTPQRRRTKKHRAKVEESNCSLALGDVIKSDPISGVVMAAALWRTHSRPSISQNAAASVWTADGPASEPPVDAVTRSAGKDAGSGRRRSGSGPKTPASETRGRGRGRKVSVPAEDWLSEVQESQSENENIGDNQAVDPDVLRSSGLAANSEAELTEPGTSGEDAAEPSSPSPLCPIADGAGDHADEPDPQQPASLVEQRLSQIRCRGARGRSRGRRSALLHPCAVTEEEAAQSGEVLLEEGVKEELKKDDGPPITEGWLSQDLDPSLPAWQQVEFNIDDVLRPLASRGQRCVRRSLRNQSSQEGSEGSGLTWLPHTSPESVRALRRKTRGRLSAAKAMQPPTPEELDH